MVLTHGGLADRRMWDHQFQALDIERAVLVGNSVGGAYSIEAALSAPEHVRGLALICSGLTEYDWPAEMTEAIGELIREAVPAERVARYWGRTAEYVDPADVAAIAEVNVRYMVAGPERSLEDLAPEVRTLALEMCRSNFMRERTLKPPIIDRLRDITAPTLIVDGEHDPSAIQEIADLMAVRIAGAKRVDLDTGHLPPIERPEETTRVLVEFVDTIS